MSSFLKKNRKFLVRIVLCVVTFIPYYQTIDFPFLNYDDPHYVNGNPDVKDGLTLQSVAWAFESGEMGSWHPVTWVSHMLDVELFGMNAGAHHMVNVLFHIVNALLLFEILLSMTGFFWSSFFVAAAFALHPMHVESVAWIAERKDVISAFFWILTIGAYHGYVKRRNTMRYAWVVICFLLGLMAKPMVVTLPLVLLLLDFWPLKRLENAEKCKKAQNNKSSVFNGKSATSNCSIGCLVIEKLPLLVPAVIIGVITLITQSNNGAVGSITAYPLAIRFANAIISYGEYIQKLFVPVHLAAFYPYPEKIAWPYVIVSFLVLFIITVTVVKTKTKYPFLIVGWLWYLITLLPVIGFIQFGLQAVADRYTYIPYIGIFIMVTWGLMTIVDRLQNSLQLFMKIVIAAIFLAMMGKTLGQIGYWKSDMKLFSHAVAVTKRNYVAYNNLGFALGQSGRIEDAIVYLKEAVNIRPDYFEAQNNLGCAYGKMGNLEYAVDRFESAILLMPEKFEPHYNLGYYCSRLGRLAEAEKELLTAIKILPGHPEPHSKLGEVYGKQKKYEDAEKELRVALRINPMHVEAMTNLGKVYLGQSRVSDAIGQFKAALEINPHYTDALKYFEFVNNKSGITP